MISENTPTVDNARQKKRHSFEIITSEMKGNVKLLSVMTLYFYCSYFFYQIIYSLKKPRNNGPIAKNFATNKANEKFCLDY